MVSNLVNGIFQHHPDLCGTVLTPEGAHGVGSAISSHPQGQEPQLAPCQEPAKLLPVDSVNHPTHYEGHGGIECIDAIRAALGHDGFVAFLRGQVLKYTWRLGRKDAAAVDAAKAQWYQNRLVATLKESSHDP